MVVAADLGGTSMSRLLEEGQRRWVKDLGRGIQRSDIPMRRTIYSCTSSLQN